MTEELLPEIREQLKTLQLAPDRPLIISDADEVLLQFFAQLETFLKRDGLYIDLANFAISGNIKSITTDEPIETPNLIEDFFATETEKITAVAGAADALANLAQDAQIVILSNLPLAQKQARIENLRAHGMDYPLIVGSGLKGAPVAWLAERVKAEVFFLDDIPHNIDSVAKTAPRVQRIHFIADPRLAKLIGAAEGATVRIDDWENAYDWIKQRLTA